MACELPSDIWIEIVEKYIPQRGDLVSLSSTSRRVRELSLPTLYHNLTFTGPTNKTHSLDRANSLLQNPHLLHHVRSIRIWRWLRVCSDPMRDAGFMPFMALEGEMQHTDDISVVTTMIAKCVNVREIRLYWCCITPQLITSICRAPFLESLILVDCENTGGTLPPGNGDVFPPLKALHYNTEHEPSHPFFPQLLSASMSSLVSLTTQPEYISHILDLPNDRPLFSQLTNLVISIASNKEASELPRFLLCCPELRHITASSAVLQLDPLQGHIIPKLEWITGSPEVLKALIPGRPVHTIHLFDAFDLMAPSDIDCFLTSSVPIRDVTVVIQRQEMITQLCRVFKGVTNIRMTLEHATPEVSKTIYDLIVNSLSQWPLLRVFLGRELYYMGNRIGGSVTHSECPIGRESKGDPSNRGHPSLKELRLFSNFTWIWYPGEGWLCREFENDF